MNPFLKVLYVLGFLLSALLIYFSSHLSNEHAGCISNEQGLLVCAASDMAKVTKFGNILLESENYDLVNHGLELDAAKNETIAFQLLLKTVEKSLPAPRPNYAKITINDLLTATDERISYQQNITLFQANYHWVEFGGYHWGPSSEVLDWPDHYPDALIPKKMSCAAATDQNVVFEKFPLPKNDDENQSVWVDVYIPKDQPAGKYKTEIHIQAGENRLTIPLQINVWEVTLPDEPSIDAVGEIYDAYVQEGIKTELSNPAWAELAHCYQQMAHRHRMVFIERLWNKAEQSLDDYNKVYDPILNGSLFTAENNYVGPGAGLPVSIWRTPWAQGFNARVKQALSEEQISAYTAQAVKWQNNVQVNNWNQTDFFAYVFDEVDGATDEDELGDVGPEYIGMVHQQMDRVQKAIDQGTGDKSIDLMWTSHTDPSVWDGIPEEDLKDIVRFWIPTANSANIEYFSNRKSEGDRVWFYHSGHPAVGIHSINASGIEMRSWGVIGARYGFDGQFMWALNLSNQQTPFKYPSYKDDDDRFGNGTFVYAGNKLDTIDMKAIPGPIPSMRLKAWRRGLQDAELIFLAKKAGHESEVDRLLGELIPSALSEGKGKASWSNDTQDWMAFRSRLLELASGSTEKPPIN